MRKLSSSERLTEYEGALENVDINDVAAFRNELFLELLRDRFDILFEDDNFSIDVSFRGEFYPGDFDTRIDPGYPDYIDSLECVLYLNDGSNHALILTKYLTKKCIAKIEQELILNFVSEKMAEREYYQEQRMTDALDK